MVAHPRCPGHERHWYTASVYVRLPFCDRCLVPNPRPLTDDQLADAEYVCSKSPRRSHAFVAAVGIEES